VSTNLTLQVSFVRLN